MAEEEELVRKAVVVVLAVAALIIERAVLVSVGKAMLVGSANLVGMALAVEVREQSVLVEPRELQGPELHQIYLALELCTQRAELDRFQVRQVLQILAMEATDHLSMVLVVAMAVAVLSSFATLTLLLHQQLPLAHQL